MMPFHFQALAQMGHDSKSNTGASSILLDTDILKHIYMCVYVCV